jgi:hypothetical protein
MRPVMLVDLAQVDIGPDVAVDDKERRISKKISGVSDGASGSQNGGLVPGKNRNRESSVSDKPLDLFMQVMGVDDDSGGAGLNQISDENLQHRNAANRKQGFGSMLGIWQQPGTETGGQNQCFHLIFK